MPVYDDLLEVNSSGLADAADLPEIERIDAGREPRTEEAKEREYVTTPQYRPERLRGGPSRRSGTDGAIPEDTSARFRSVHKGRLATPAQ